MHYPKSPSASQRLFNCPGSYKLGSGRETETSEYAEEGTDFHSLVEDVLKHGKRTFTGDHAKDHHVGRAVQLIEAQRQFFDKVLAEGIEDHIVSKYIEDLGGTVDYWVFGWVGERLVLIILDLKYGVQEVYVDDNTQLMSYALLVIEKLGRQVDEIYGIIFQPRSLKHPEPKETQFSSDELLEVAQKWNDIDNAPDEFKIGDHCQYCPCKTDCPVLQPLVAQTQQPFEFPANYAELLAAEKLVKSFFEQLRFVLISRIKSGEDVEGFKAVQSYGYRKWSKDEDAYDALKAAGLSFDDLHTERQFVSPSALEKAFPEHKKLISELVVKPAKGVTLAKESDKRQALTFTKAKDEFTDLEV